MRVLGASPLAYDVIDVDTYGSPWKHWQALLPNLRAPTTVFLTIGKAGGVTSVDTVALQALGLGTLVKVIPPSLLWQLAPDAERAALALALDRGSVPWCIAGEARNARYVGLRFVPRG